MPAPKKPQGNKPYHYHNNSVGIQIAGSSLQAVEALQAAIMAILDARADQETIRKALEVLEKGVGTPNNIYVSDTHINTGRQI